MILFHPVPKPVLLLQHQTIQHVNLNHIIGNQDGERRKITFLSKSPHMTVGKARGSGEGGVGAAVWRL